MSSGSVPGISNRGAERVQLTATEELNARIAREYVRDEKLLALLGLRAP
ncbi:MAG: hypothetical protein IT530_20525 [Burkholderiales bacterium]|nr:hypothetical protein [Burkholderiales bacterium]